MPSTKESQQTQKEKDTELLAKFGYKQDLLRQMGGFSNFAISFSIISILTGLISMFGYGVNLVGGFAYWTWVTVAFFQLFNAVSMGEMASSFPLAGGLYPWARHLASPKTGWWVGWINMIAWWAVTVAIDASLAGFLASSGWFGLQSNTPTVVIITIIAMTIQMVMNIFGIKLVSWFNNFSVWVHMIGTVLLFTLLLWLGHAHPFSFIVDAHVPDATGTAMTNVGPGSGLFLLAFLPAILMSAWTLTAFDASADVSEETEDPQHTVPWGMVIAVVASFIFGSLVLFGLIRNIPSDPSVIAANQDNLASYIIQHVLGSGLALPMMAIICLAQFACGLSSSTVFQRVIFSLSRDNNLPFSNQLKKVRKNGSPYMAAIIGTIAMAVLTVGASLIGDTVLPTVTSIATVGFYFGYFIVIILGVRARLNGRWSQRGPWNVGKLWFPIAFVAILWNLFISVDMVLPPNLVTLYLFGGIMVLLAIYFFAVKQRQLSDTLALTADELDKLEHQQEREAEESVTDE